MTRFSILVVIFLVVTGLAFAQRVPVLVQPPGQHEQQEEIARLQKLVLQQQEKISLLEQKVQLLESDLKKCKEAPK